MMCQRHGCEQSATMCVEFNRYRDVPPIPEGGFYGPTLACMRHGQWWTLGPDGTRIGRAVGINR